MEKTTIDNPVNQEVFRIYRELSPPQGDLFLSQVTSHLRGVKNATVQTVRDFYYKIWLDAASREAHDRAILGADY